MSNPFFSVIIPCYNIEGYLVKCLDSIIEQTFPDFEIILIDDGSTDNSGTICEKYKNKDSRIIVQHQVNSGVSVARNTGIKLSKAKWIFFIDPDDWIEKNALEKLHRVITNNNADVYLFDYFQEFSQKQINKQLFGTSHLLDKKEVESLRMAPFNQLVLDGKVVEYETNVIWNKVYNAEILKRNELLFFPEARKGQDVIFNAEAFQLLKSFFYIHETLYHYRYIESSITNRFNPKVRFYNEIAFEHYERIIKKYNLPKIYENNYHVRVLTRLYSCLRLFYFHSQNTLKWSQKKQELDSILLSYPYNVSLKNLNVLELPFGQRAFIFCLRHRMYFALWGLVKGRLLLQRIRGKKLS